VTAASLAVPQTPGSTPYSNGNPFWQRLWSIFSMALMSECVDAIFCNNGWQFFMSSAIQYLKPFKFSFVQFLLKLLGGLFSEC
jgi:hypothetical protein